MSISRATEKSLLDHEEWTLVERTHLPALKALSEAELSETGRRLRGLHDKQRDLARAKRRIARGKAEPRGGSFPGTEDRPRQRKQVFAQALKRVNGEFERRRAHVSRQQMIDAQRRVLEARAAGGSNRPANTRTARTGATPVENRKRTTRVPGAKVGSVSQATKRAQARKDG
ncbi:MAG: hypothetical protein ACK4Z0_01210 [Sphingomonadaceae bacterium]